MTINLLLIDDTAITYDGLSAINDLFKETYHSEIYWAEDEAAALVRLNERKYDLVLCDTRFYGQDIGPEIADRLNQLYPDLRIIGMSSTAEYELWKGKHEFMDKTHINLRWLEEFYKQCIKEEKMTIDILLVENSMFSVYGRLKTCIQQIKETYDLGDVHQVGDLKSALNQLGKSRRIGLVFCDTQFGGALNGPDIAKAISEAYNNLPIVGISVNPDHKPLWEPYDFVLKRDFNTNYLREILDKHK